MKRTVLTAVPVLVLAGLLTACGGAPADDAPAATETTAPAATTAEAPAEEAPAPETVEEPAAEPAETSSDEVINFAEDPYALPVYGQSVDTYGVITTMSEPEKTGTVSEDYYPEYAGMDLVTVEVTMENTLNKAILVEETLSWDVFSGMAEGHPIMNDDESIPATPNSIPVGRTATWTESFAVADADDVIIAMTTPTETVINFFTQAEIDRMNDIPESE